MLRVFAFRPWGVRFSTWALAALVLMPRLLGAEAEPVGEAVVAQLATQLGHSDKEERRKAVYALNGLGPAAAGALDALIGAVEDDDDQVWNQAVMTLANLGPLAEPAIPRLIEAIEGRSRYGEQRRLRVAFALGKIGPAAIRPLRAFLTEKAPDENGRWTAAKALGWIGAPAAEAIPEVVVLLSDQDDSVRREAAEALVRFGEASLPAFTERLSHESATVRREAAYGLRRLGLVDPATRGALLTALQEETEVSVKSEMLLALVVLEADRELLTPILVESLLSEKEGLANAAMDAMVAMDRPEIELVPALAALLQSPEKSVRLPGIHALGLLGERAASGAATLIDLLRSKDPGAEESVAAVDALIALGPVSVETFLAALPEMSSEELTEDHWSTRLVKTLAIRAQSVLEAHAGSASPPVRYVLLVGLGELPKMSPVTRRLVMASLGDADGRVRARAVGYLPNLKLAAGQRASLLRQAAEDEDAEVRRAAVAVATTIPEQRLALEVLTKSLTDEDEQVQREAVVRFGELGERGRTALPHLVVKLEKDPDPMKAMVLQTMARMGSAATEALPLLRELARGEVSTEVRSRVFLCLSAIGSEAADALPQVREGLRHPEPEVRSAALAAFIRLEESPEAQLAVLVELLEDPSPEVKLAAVNAVGTLGSNAETVAPKIWTLLAESSEPRPVLEALRKIPYGKPDLYLQALSHEDPAVRLFACDRLGDLGDKAKEAIPALRKAEDDSYSFVARRARKARRMIEGRD